MYYLADPFAIALPFVWIGVGISFFLLARKTKSVNGINGVNGVKNLGGDNISIADTVIGYLSIASFFGSLVNGFATLFKSAMEEENKVVDCLVITSYYLALSPSISSSLDPDAAENWSNLNIAFTFISVAKCCIDNLSPLSKHKFWADSMSPFVERYIDLVWFLPTIGTFVDLKANSKVKTSDVEGFVGGVVGNLVGVCTPLTIKEIFPEFAPIMAIALCAATVLAGGATLLAGMAILGGD